MSGLEAARRFALALPGVTEEPHSGMVSFRVRGKIFVTVPPEGARLHVFADPLAVTGYVAEDPAAFEPLCWGGKTRGLRVNLAAAAAAFDEGRPGLTAARWTGRPPGQPASCWLVRPRPA